MAPSIISQHPQLKKPAMPAVEEKKSSAFNFLGEIPSYGPPLHESKTSVVVDEKPKTIQVPEE